MTESRYVRFSPASSEVPRWGIVEGPNVLELGSVPWAADCRPTGIAHQRDAVRLLAPAEPTKILALGYNFRALFEDPAARTSSREAHFTDPGFEPLVFLKGPNSLIGPGESIPLPPDAVEVWVEVEVAAVIGKRARNLSSANAAREVVFGITIANDVTALNILGRDWHLARSKALDGFCPLGPELVRGFDDSECLLTTKINGRETQSSRSSDRVLDTYQSVALLSRLMTLEPGDIVSTGTPRGGRQSIIRDGDVVELCIEGLGPLVNPVAMERQR